MSNRKTAMQMALAKLKDIEAERPYKVKGAFDTYTEYNEGWSAACDILEQALQELLHAERAQIEQAYDRIAIISNGDTQYFNGNTLAIDYYDKTYGDGKD